MFPQYNNMIIKTKTTLSKPKNGRNGPLEVGEGREILERR
jgi:hypothetical protein